MQVWQLHQTGKFIISNFPSHDKKRHMFRFIDDNNSQVIKLVFTYFALKVHCSYFLLSCTLLV